MPSRYFRIPVEEMGYVRAVLEGYDGVALLHAPDPRRGEAEWVIGEGLEDEADEIAARLEKESGVVAIARPAGWVGIGVLILTLALGGRATAQEAPVQVEASAAAGDSAPQDASPAPAASPPAAPASAAPASNPSAANPAPAAKDDFNFDLGVQAKVHPATDMAAQAKAAQIAKQVQLRRKMLQTHQAFGFVTLGLLALSAILGTLNYVDKFGGGDYTGKYDAAHTAFSLGGAATFAVGGILGLTAPTPYKKPIRADVALLHKVMMGIATACFVAEIILGPISAARSGKLDQRDYAGAHMGIGYTAFAAVTTGWLAFVVK